MSIDISAVHELWAAPKENWLDYFVHATRFQKALNVNEKTTEQREELRALVLQFAEQAMLAEAEADMLNKKLFGPEDVYFHERKAACLWLCSLASLAAIDWHFESLVVRTEDVILVNALFEKIDAWKDHLSPSGDAGSLPFAALLTARWHMFLYGRFRVAPPDAKQTVSNPCNQLDPAMQKFDLARTIIAKLRDKVDESQLVVETLQLDEKRLWVPRPDCFVDPFIESGGLSMSIGIVGENILAEDDESIRPRVLTGVEKDTVVLSPEQVKQKLHYDLANSFFCSVRMGKAVKHLKQLLKCRLPAAACEHPLLAIDTHRINGLAAACKLQHLLKPEASPSTSKIEVTGEITVKDVNPRRVPQRRYGTRRDRAEEERMHASRIPYRRSAGSLVDDLWCGGGAVGWREKMERERERERKQVRERLQHLTTAATLPKTKSMAKGIARFLSVAVQPSGATSLSTVVARLSSPMPSPPPSAASIRAMAASDKPFWTLLTSFDAAELQTALKLEGAQYTRPAMLRFPEVLADVLLSSRSFDELHALLLGKLQQLTEMGRWRSILDVFIPIVGANTTQSLMEMTIYEATRVQVLSVNRRLLTPHLDSAPEKVNLARGVATKLVKIAQVQPLVGPMVAFLLNMSEFNFVCQKLDPEAGTGNVLLNAGRILAAFGGFDTQQNSTGNAQVATTWHGVIGPYFEAVASKRRHDGFTTMHLRETSRVRVELMRMFEAIRIPKLRSFLISYFAHLYTQALSSRGRLHLRVHAQYVEMFGGNSLSLAHMESLEEVLSMLIERGLTLMPHSTSLLRTKADFYYVRNQLNEAGVAYCELLVAMSPTLSMPIPSGKEGMNRAPEGVVDEGVWNHLRICLRKNHQQTLAAAVCQLFKTGRAKEFRKAAEAVQERACLDASDDCFRFIYDIQLAEALTDAYKKRGEQQKLDSLLEVIGSATMNPNNSSECVERELRRKQKKLLATIVSLHFGVHS